MARLPIDAALLHVFRDADHGVPRHLRAAARTQPLADRVLPLPEGIHQRLVDDRDHAGRRRIGGLERPALDDGNAHRLEVAGHHVLVVVDVLVRSLGRRRVVVDVGVVRVERPVRRQARHRGRSLHAGHGAQPVEQTLIHLRARPRLRIVGRRQRQRERHQPRSLEAGVDGGQVVDGAQQQAGADHQHDGQRHFDHHQPAADVMARRAGRALRPAFLECGDQALHAGVHQRCEAEHQAGRDRHAEREQQHERVDGHLRRARQAGGIHPNQRLDAGAREHRRRARRRRATAGRLRS